ncbi:MAG: polyprenyl synthetase family protein [bacterium]|nr:polyprenyl synthetase family protein [bacterium]
MSEGTSVEMIAGHLNRWAREFDEHLAALATPAPERPPRNAPTEPNRESTGRSPAGPAGDCPSQRLLEAMRYSLLAPGKRLRPYLVCRCCELAGGPAEAAVAAAAAVECVHAFSLIHDDLPAMDDDRLRRGRPTAHIQFDEATAILAGDALLTRAFELLAELVPDSRLAARMIRELARAAGAAGMIGGQAADIEGEGRPPDQALTETIHRHKTARLFECACRLGALLADTDPGLVEALAAYGGHLGGAFQIADDLLDVTADAGTLGKNVRKDAVADKQTFVRCVGTTESRRLASAAVEQAVASLGDFGPEADDLRALAWYVLERPC